MKNYVRQMLLVISLMLPMFLLSQEVYSATWQLTGPFGGDIKAFVVDPTIPQTLYSGTLGGGVFKSVDSGDTWSAVNSGLTNTTIYSLAIDPTNAQIIYAGTSGSGVFKSINGGTTWSAFNIGMEGT